MFLLNLSHFSSFLRVTSLHRLRLSGEQVLDGKNLVKQLELLLCNFLVSIVDLDAIELIDVLEPVDNK